VGGLLTSAAGGDVQVGINAAQNEVQNNYLSPKERSNLTKAQQDCARGDFDACLLRDNLVRLDKTRDEVVDRALESCSGPSCEPVRDQIATWQKGERAAPGEECLAPYNCGGSDASNRNLLDQWAGRGLDRYDSPLEGAYPELWLMDGLAVLDLARGGIAFVRAGATLFDDVAAAGARGLSEFGSVASTGVGDLSVGLRARTVSEVGSVVSTSTGTITEAQEIALATGRGPLIAEAAAKDTTVVIGRVKDLESLALGEVSLLDRLPYLRTPKANGQQNAGVLREAMARGLPIRDASPLDTTGQFLNAERNLLRNNGWTFDRATNYWMPPRRL
jgi:hypothetical protein